MSTPLQSLSERIAPLAQRLRRPKESTPGVKLLSLDRMLSAGAIRLADLDEWKTSSRKEGAAAGRGSGRESYSFAFDAGRDRMLQCRLFLPEGKPPYPAFVFNFGIGANVEFAYLARHVSRAGWAVLVPAYWGIQRSMPLAEDIENCAKAFRFLISLDVVQKGQVGIVGASYGAALALTAAADRRIAKDVRYVVSIDGPADVLDLIAYTKTGQNVGRRVKVLLRKKMRLLVLDEVRAFRSRQQRGRAAGAPDAQPLPGLYKDLFLVEELQQAKDAETVSGLLGETSPYLRGKLEALSPLRHLSGITARVLFIHGRKDSIVPCEHSVRMHEAMRAMGKESELILIEGLGHGIWIAQPRELISFLRKDGRATLERIAAFMRR